ncbi:MAG: H-NS histone family protein [Cardiobacteriaceae bacterium]|nr:H-NS histone family protein [Cardiobacteriaceae bacterium]
MEKLFAEVDRLNNDDFELLINHIDKQKRKRARDILAEAQRQAARFVQDFDKGMKMPAAGRASKPAKYANPKDPSQTWSGFGRQPDWVKDYIDAGGNKDDLLIRS